MTITIRQLTERILAHMNPDHPLTPELGKEIADFVRGQAEPHAVFRINDVGVLCCSVTGHMEATFPAHKLSGYPTPMDALASAASWALSAGALTWEWLPHDPVVSSLPVQREVDCTYGRASFTKVTPFVPDPDEPLRDTFKAKGAPNPEPEEEESPEIGTGPCYSRRCDAGRCTTDVLEENAHYIANPSQTDIPLPDLRLCRYHAEMYDPDDVAMYRQAFLARVVDEPERLCEHCGGVIDDDDPRLCEPCRMPEEEEEDDATGDLTLDRHSSLWQVVRCMQNAIKLISDNEYIYADDDKDTNIHHEEVDVIVNHLTHGNEWSAIQYSDFMDMEEES